MEAIPSGVFYGSLFAQREWNIGQNSTLDKNAHSSCTKQPNTLGYHHYGKSNESHQGAPRQSALAPRPRRGALFKVWSLRRPAQEPHRLHEMRIL